VRLRETRFVGMDAGRATDILERRGFSVEPTTRDLPEDEGDGAEPGTVAAVDPHGRVRPDATVELTVWSAGDGDEDAKPKPKPKPRDKPHGHDKPKHEPKPPKPGHDKHGPGHEKPKGAKK
jgi:hypothetical protein